MFRKAGRYFGRLEAVFEDIAGLDDPSDKEDSDDEDGGQGGKKGKGKGKAAAGS